jgi:hypothetical protein
MDRLPPARAATRTLDQHRDARDLRAVVVDALAAAPIDEQALRDGVWTYVRGERQVGVAPGLVILALTDMVERARIVSDDVRITRTRDVILWCVEAYFGQLGGTNIGRGRTASVDESADESAEELEQETPRASA